MDLIFGPRKSRKVKVLFHRLFTADDKVRIM